MKHLFSQLKVPLILALILSLNACHNYKPGYINSPNFEDKDDLYIDVNLGSQLGGSISYSPLKKWGILINAGEAGTLNDEADPNYFVNQDKAFVKSFDYPSHFYEFASGYYSKIKDNFYLDFYMGYGKGSAGASLLRLDLFIKDQDLVAYKSDFENVFLQTDFKVFVSDNVRFNISGRMNMLNFYGFEYVFEEPIEQNYSMNPNGPLPPQGEINAYFRDRRRIAYQLGFGYEIDLEHFILTSQVQFGLEDYKLDDPPNFYSVRPFSLFLGLSVPIHQFWEKED